jgi:hypothetical protein
VRLRGHRRRWRFRRQEVGAGGPPTEREGAAHELPVVPDSEFRLYLVLCPAQSLLDLLVALLHPHLQPAVRSGHLGDADRRFRYLRPARNLRCPMWPRHAPLSSPTYPTPIIPTRNFFSQAIFSCLFVCYRHHAPNYQHLPPQARAYYRSIETARLIRSGSNYTLSTVVIVHVPSNKTLDAFLDGRLGLEPDISCKIVHVGVRR